MRLLELRIQNYRTITNLSLSFPSYYTAICGRNDAGKTNLIRVLRSAFQNPDRPFIFQEEEISIKEDFPKWLEGNTSAAARSITLSFVLEISKESDEGLHRFIQDYLSLSEPLLLQPSLTVTLSLRRSGDEKTEQVGLTIGGDPYETNKAQEVYKRLRSSLTMLFHDSTEFFHPYRFRQAADIFKNMSAEDGIKVKDAQSNLNKTLNRVAKRSQQDLTEMLGRLKDKYKVALGITNPDYSEIPYTITLGTDDGQVQLENWGSGTQNRTRILMTLFRAKQIRESQGSPDKLTPVIIIEEPESYLHPSAQAEFGRTLRDLAEEFKIQVIVTTHSPYLLSFSQCEANILLERKIDRKRARETQQVAVTGNSWMEPFARVLGIGDQELAPWKDALFSGKDSIILVEGITDKAYLELLMQEHHGDERLIFAGSIFAYGGKDTLKQKEIVRLVKSQFKKFVVTYDLDCDNELDRVMRDLGLTKKVDYLAIGRDQSGLKNMEGLLPERILKEVYSQHYELVQKATQATGDEAKSAKAALKSRLLERFREAAVPKTEDFKSFYELAKQINKILGG